MHTIQIRRVYEAPDPADGRRILVDRIWPRGLSKEKAQIDYWAREIAPTTELRRWYGHDPDKWSEFKKRYFAELNGNVEKVRELLAYLEKEPGTFVYGSKEQALNNAFALREYVESRGQR